MTAKQCWSCRVAGVHFQCARWCACCGSRVAAHARPVPYRRRAVLLLVAALLTLPLTLVLDVGWLLPVLVCVAELALAGAAYAKSRLPAGSDPAARPPLLLRPGGEDVPRGSRTGHEIPSRAGRSAPTTGSSSDGRWWARARKT